MEMAIIGGGFSAKAIKQALNEYGVTPTLHSRSTGFDVLQDDAISR
ncbi:hypothetical protein J7I84_07040 [Arthrobacter sp. ISL-85]|nr:hypothetical protein [Arthrobacter sp. ISL-85]MBT2566256.1 hypothetical protein [Arthrobacter sp. ISL-85]